MAVSRQRQLQIDKRRLQVAELALKGCRQIEIAERLGVAQATVSLDLKRLRAKWQASAAADIQRVIARQFDKLALIEREAWDAWERSKQPSHVSVVYRGGEHEPTKMRQTLKHPTGDPRYLEQLLKCLAATRELIGLGGSKQQPGAAARSDEITLAEAIQMTLFDERFHAAPPPGAEPVQPPCWTDRPPPNLVDPVAAYEQFAADYRRRLETPPPEPPPAEE